MNKVEMTLQVRWDRVGEGPDHRLPAIGVVEDRELGIEQVICLADWDR